MADLANDVQAIQALTQQQADRIKKQNDQAYDVLQQIATNAGYPSVDDYIQKALDALPPEERKKYLDLRAKIKGKDKDIEITLYTFGILFGIGSAVGIFSTQLLNNSQAAVRSANYIPASTRVLNVLTKAREAVVAWEWVGKMTGRVVASAGKAAMKSFMGWTIDQDSS